MKILIDIDTSCTLAVNQFNSPWFDRFFFSFTQTVVWIPLALLLVFLIYRRWRWNSVWIILFLALAILAADQISSSLIKPVVERFRPSRNPDIAGMVHIVNDYRGGLYGFVSSHAANAAAFVLFTSLVFKRVLYSVSFSLWALLTAYSRVYLGVHYLGDILCGAAVGLAVGGLMYWLMIKVTPFGKSDRTVGIYPLFDIILTVCLIVNTVIIAIFC